LLAAAPDGDIIDMARNGDHNARALALAPDGSIYISSGSDCNVFSGRW